MCITCPCGFQCFGHTRRATVKGDNGPEVAGVCVVESHEYHGCMCVRVHVCVCVYTCVCVCARARVCACVSLSLPPFLSVCLSVFLSAHACLRVRACVRRVVLCWVDRATRIKGVRLHYHTTCRTHSHTVLAPIWARHTHTHGPCKM